MTHQDHAAAATPCSRPVRDYLRAEVSRGRQSTVLRYPWPPERTVEVLAAPIKEPSMPTEPSLSGIMDEVEKATGIGRLDLVSDRRYAPLVRARTIYYYAAKTLTSKSLVAIARACGDRDHTTIMHGIAKVEADRAAFEPELGRVISRMTMLGELTP